ncbi:MAG: T9SS type A sorting domain-containing protein [Saprospiraceae bacterium]|nr:T9SS type A sorting domain-containing protein [Saprospiraceae bacterium]
MKYLILLFILIPTILFAQKYDKNWVMGAVTTTYPAPNYEMIVMQHQEDGSHSFDTIPRVPKYRLTDCSASYSDKEGILKYYSNGKAIYNINGEVMENGDSINFGYKWTTSSQSYIASNSMVPLPDITYPDSISLLVHAIVDTGNIHAGLGLYISKLLYSRIDLTKNNGLGDVLEKNILISNGCFEYFAMTRHGNGRDWWIASPKTHQNILQSYLITSNGVLDSNIQIIGPPLFDTINNLSNAYGFLAFSQDGRYLARQNTHVALWLYEFDRCTGKFLNMRSVPFDPVGKPGDGLVTDMEFSPSGQYLYILNSGANIMYQVDIWKDTLVMVPMDPEIKIKEKCQYGRRVAQLGPDGKIYISPGGSSLCMHIIHNPDLPYPDCNFVLGDIDLPVYNHGSLVHYPNYRLGPLEGSPCDTLGSMSSTFDPEINHQTFRIYPNPAISVLRLELDAYLNHTQEIKIRVMHPTGQLVYSGTLPPYAYMHDIAVHEWSSGLYLVQLLRSDGQELGVEKLIVE